MEEGRESFLSFPRSPPPKGQQSLCLTLNSDWNESKFFKNSFTFSKVHFVPVGVKLYFYIKVMQN